MKLHPKIRSLFLPAVVAAICLSLSGCGKTLDVRNAEINNGKVYAADANTPFSGAVTNLPFTTVFGSQQGLGHVLNVIGSARPATTSAELGMTAICDAHAHDGLLDGKVTCKAPQSETVRIEAKFSDGALDGPFTVNDETGNNTFVELSFKNGAPDGKMKINSPKTGKLVHVASWDAGVLSGDEKGFDETTGNRLLHATLANGKYEGEFTRYAPDGNQIIYKANFLQGQHDGDEESFDPQTGKMTGQAHYSNGKLNGLAQAWDSTGKLIAEKTYDNGIDVEAAKEEQAKKDAAQAQMAILNSPAVTDCVHNFEGEYMKRNAGAGIYNDMMIGEWRTQCQQQALAAQSQGAQSTPPQNTSAQ